MDCLSGLLLDVGQAELFFCVVMFLHGWMHTPQKVEARERRVAAEEAALELQASKQAEEAQALQRRLREEARYQGERDRRRAQEQEARATRLEKQLEVRMWSWD